VQAARGVVGLHHAGLGQPPLHLLSERVGVADEEGGQCVGLVDEVGPELERVGGIDHHLVGEVVRARELDGVLGAGAAGGQHDEFAEARGCHEGAR
jgi:hypothetical protein